MFDIIAGRVGYDDGRWVVIGDSRRIIIGYRRYRVVIRARAIKCAWSYINADANASGKGRAAGAQNNQRQKGGAYRRCLHDDLLEKGWTYR